MQAPAHIVEGLFGHGIKICFLNFLFSNFSVCICVWGVGAEGGRGKIHQLPTVFRGFSCLLMPSAYTYFAKLRYVILLLNCSSPF